MEILAEHFVFSSIVEVLLGNNKTAILMPQILTPKTLYWFYITNSERVLNYTKVCCQLFNFI